MKCMDCLGNVTEDTPGKPVPHPSRQRAVKNSGIAEGFHTCRKIL